MFPSYQLIQIMIEPKDLGLGGIRRKRSFIFLRHKFRCEYVLDVFEVFEMISSELKKRVSTQPRDYLVSSDSVRQLQNAHMARKRKIDFDPDSRLQFKKSEDNTRLNSHDYPNITNDTMLLFYLRILTNWCHWALHEYFLS